MLHVSCTYPACLLHIRYVDLWMHLRYMYLMMYISGVSRMYLDHLCRYMYPECISIVSRMYLACILHLSYVPHWIYSRYAFQIVSRMYPVQDTCIMILYLGVS